MPQSEFKETVFHGIERLLKAFTTNPPPILFPGRQWGRLGATPKPTVWQREYHGFFEMAYVDKGNCAMVFDGESFLLEEGQVCLIPPEQFHYITPTLEDHSYTIYWFNANPPRIAVHATIYSGQGNNDELLGGVVTEWGKSAQQLFALIYQELSSNGEYSDDIARGHLIAFLGLVCREVKQLLKDEEAAFNTWRDRVVDDVVGFIDDNYGDANLCVQDLANHVALSASYLSAYFREKTGRTPYQYLVSVRMEQARCLLRTTEHSVASISAIVGFSSPYYFSSAFKRFHGTSPTGYRHPVQLGS